MYSYSAFALLTFGMAIFMFGLLAGMWVRRKQIVVFDMKTDGRKTLDGTEHTQRILDRYFWNKDVQIAQRKDAS